MMRVKRRLKILMTDGSSTSARQSLTCLGQQHTIDILDPSPLCQCRFSRFVKRWHRCPPFSRQPENYLHAILDLLEHERYDVLFPTHEQIYLLSRFRHLFVPRVAMAVPEFEAMDRMMNKVKFAKLVDEVGLPQPGWKIARTRQDLMDFEHFPCWVKLDFSTAGQGVRHATDRNDLDLIANDLTKQGWLNGIHEILIQKHSKGAKRGATGVFQNGLLIAFHCYQSRGIGVGGSAKSKISVHDPEMIGFMEKLGAHLNWHGAMCLEYMFDADQGRYSIFECNPRIGETVLAFDGGVNLCQALVDVSLGTAHVSETVGLAGTKSHLGFLALTAMALEGASRTQILGEMVLAMRSQGEYRDSSDEITRWSEDWLSIVPYFGVTALLLLDPHAASWLVRKTVENYSLSSDGAQRIRNLRIQEPKSEAV
ncbi:MAG: hypothetical protein SGI77_05860 [Pirellulaceae bacterium]|nr:hypothetical protein [Pirellulaceae bacterium]